MKSEIKKKCYQDQIKNEVLDIEIVLNEIQKIRDYDETFDEQFIEKELIKTYCQFELSLASLCIMIRKMVENQFIEIDFDLRKDLNSVIHANKFEFVNETLCYAYSQKGKEDINVERILNKAKDIISKE